MKILKTSLIIFAFGFYGCSGSPVGITDEDKLKSMSEKPNIQQMVGRWHADKFSYKLSEKKSYPVDTMSLILDKDMTFKAFNLPAYVTTSDTVPLEKMLVNAKGKWHLQINNSNIWELALDFNPGKLYKSGLHENYQLYMQNSKALIWHFVGDPDSGERLAFSKY